MLQPVGASHNQLLPTMPDYGLSFTPPVVGSHLLQLEGLDSQACYPFIFHSWVSIFPCVFLELSDLIKLNLFSHFSSFPVSLFKFHIESLAIIYLHVNTCHSRVEAHWSHQLVQHLICLNPEEFPRIPSPYHHSCFLSSGNHILLITYHTALTFLSFICLPKIHTNC